MKIRALFVIFFFFINKAIVCAQDVTLFTVSLNTFSQNPAFVDSITTHYKVGSLKRTIKKDPKIVNSIFIDNLIMLKQKEEGFRRKKELMSFQTNINAYLSDEQYNMNIFSLIDHAHHTELTKKMANYVINRRPYNSTYYALLPIIITKASKKAKEEIAKEFLAKRQSEKTVEVLRATWALGKALAKSGDLSALEYIISILDNPKNLKPSIIKELGQLNVREITNYLIELIIVKNANKEPIENSESNIATIIFVMHNTIEEFRSDMYNERFVGVISTETLTEWYQKNKNTYSFIKKNKVW